MTTLEAVRAKIIEANPIDYGEMPGYLQDRENASRVIRLSDVLAAIGGNEPIHLGWSSGGYAYFITNEGDNIVANWNLRADSLDEQSPETVAFLAKVLGVEVD